MSKPEVVVSYQLHLRDGCPYCDAALDLVKDRGLEYYATIHKRGALGLIEEQTRHDHHTVPVITKTILVEGEEEEVLLIGGYTELKEHLEGEDNNG
tara:strand:- start:546 stop:833 length:288 start_codon:yes stop_codon:yes gene_type:complete